uniref:SAM domain-containing protein n=1 Tax=Timema monikensis TaxID=170555 RepID=A0A7R9EE92_9NEOP|nr:unnamed protein product [Timema monikensis]
MFLLEGRTSHPALLPDPKTVWTVAKYWPTLASLNIAGATSFITELFRSVIVELSKELHRDPQAVLLLSAFVYLGGDESSPDDEESTLKCTAPAWSGSESAHGSSSSELSSSEDEGGKHHRRHNEDLTTTGCEEDFQWIRSSSQMDTEKQPNLDAEAEIISQEKQPSLTSSKTPNISSNEDQDKINLFENHEFEPQVMSSPLDVISKVFSHREEIRPSKSPNPFSSESNMYSDDKSNLLLSYEDHRSSPFNISLQRPPRGDTHIKVPHQGHEKSGSLDRRRRHNGNRVNRDQKSKSTILTNSPRYRSPSRQTLSDCHYNSPPSCCGDSAKVHYGGNSRCCGHECYIHNSPHDSEHYQCGCGSREDCMVPFDTCETSDQFHRHQYGSANRLDAHRHPHVCGSHQDLMYLSDSGGDLSHCCSFRSLPLCRHCSSEQQLCRRRQISKPPGELEERLKRLESDKDSLQLQVTVLNQQIEAQSDKIADLEKMLDEKKQQLGSTEEVLQRELLSRSSLETQKLELLSALSDLKLQQATVERENLELREKLGDERRRNKPPAGPRAALLATSTPNNSHITAQLLGGSPSPSPVSSHSDGSPRRLGHHPNNPEDFKDIPPPRTPPTNYRRKVEHYGSLPRHRNGMNGSIVCSPALDGSPLVSSGVPRKGVAFGKGLNSFLPFHVQQHHLHLQLLQRRVGADKSYSTPNLAETERVVIEDQSVDEEEQPIESSLSPQSSPSLQINKTKGIKKILGRGYPKVLVCGQIDRAQKTGPTTSTGTNNIIPLVTTDHLGLHKLNTLLKTCFPILQSSTPTQHIFKEPPKVNYKQPANMRNFLVKPKLIKRSGSGNLEDLPGEGEFRRGGVRATAGPRLGWSTQFPVKQLPDIPFADWDSDAISQWLHDLGLEIYAADAKRWVKSGAQFLAASSQEIDKELGIKNLLHRKKLQLALLSKQEAVASLDPPLGPAGLLDTSWVLRWLDDAGLPQHKEAFLATRVDGRVLHRLTMDDLAVLHVTSHLHIASLRRGIQVLRDHNFDGNCLKRRSQPEDSPHPQASDVALWTNHRVMEWLRVVDLAEYAPNLRGSGVHGGLMVHEPRFTADLLASLLSIPPSKTLLRRHLSTHFKELLGRDCIQEKREAETTLGYIPLSATTKIKIAKKSQFTLKRKKSKSELDFGDLVCPLDPNKTGEPSHGDGVSFD